MDEMEWCHHDVIIIRAQMTMEFPNWLVICTANQQNDRMSSVAVHSKVREGISGQSYNSGHGIAHFTAIALTPLAIFLIYGKCTCILYLRTF